MARRLIRRVEHAGERWAQRRDGRWLRWDMDANDWSGPLAPPFESPEPDSVGWARGAPRTEQPPIPVDRWWNRRFPPHSTARLLFLLVALPFVAVFHALVQHILGKDVSLAQYLFVWIVGSVLLSFWWASGELKRGTSAPRPDADPDPAPQAAPRYRPTVRDFIVGVPFGFAGALVLQWAMGGANDALTGSGLLASLVGGIAVSAIVVLRYTIWGLLLFSALVGLGGAIFLQLFLLFSTNEPSFLEAWLISTLLALGLFAPFWWALRSGRLAGWHPGGRRPLPWPAPGRFRRSPEPRMWVLMTSVLIMLTGAAVLFRLTGGA